WPLCLSAPCALLHRQPIDNRPSDVHCNNWPYSRSQESRGEMRSFFGLFNFPEVSAAVSESSSRLRAQPPHAPHHPQTCLANVTKTSALSLDTWTLSSGSVVVIPLAARSRDLNSPLKAASQSRPCTHRLDHERSSFCSHSFHPSVPVLTFLPLPLCLPSSSSFFLPRLLSPTSSITIAPPIPTFALTSYSVPLRPVPASCPARIPCLIPLSFTSGPYPPPPPRPYLASSLFSSLICTRPHPAASPFCPSCLRVPAFPSSTYALHYPACLASSPYPPRPRLPMSTSFPPPPRLIPAATCLPVPAAPSSRTPLSRAVPRSLEPYPGPARPPSRRLPAATLPRRPRPRPRSRFSAAPSRRTPVPPPSLRHPTRRTCPRLPPVPASPPLPRTVPPVPALPPPSRPLLLVPPPTYLPLYLALTLRCSTQ
ncbi:hypothetical protein DFH09DRAFT_1436832, partial [Mycena vulgaris]